jgi:hypothetical protein
MKLHIIFALIATAIPSFAIGMEKASILGKRSVQEFDIDLDESRQAKIAKVDDPAPVGVAPVIPRYIIFEEESSTSETEDDLMGQDETNNDNFTSLITAANQVTPITTPLPTPTNSKKLHKCTYTGCNYAAAFKSILDQHNKIHTGEKPYKCSHVGCNYAAIQTSNLKRHIRTHTGEKQHKCTYEGCNYAAAQQSALTEHIRIHTGKKPYKCTHEGCDFAAAQKGNLDDHIKTHTGEKPHKCTYEGCDFATAFRSSLTRHIKTKHPHRVGSLPALIAAANQATPVSTPFALLESEKNIENGDKL